MKAVIVALIATTILALPGYAQDSAPVTEPQTFVDMAASSNMFEIASSKVALQNAVRQPTKEFAQHMIDDHSKAGEEMKAAAEAEGMTVPTALDDKHQAAMDKLTAARGEAFDQSFLAEQYAAHEEAVALFTSYTANGARGTLKDFAAKTLPTLKAHLEEVQKLTAGK